MYGRIYALFGCFLACQFLFCYDPSEGVPNLIFSLYLWRKIDKDMRIEQNFSLEKYNTFHLPVKTRWFLEYADEADLQKVLHDEYFQECLSQHIGQGSNLLFVNDYNGIILHSAIRGMEVVRETDESVWLRIGAGETWDDVVAYVVSQGWGGIENLSGIPGETGAAAVQNIGAYGAEIKDVIDTVEAWNQLTFEKHCFSAEECGYAYRWSRFKDPHADPHIVTYLVLKLAKNPVFNLEYGALKEVKEPTLAKVREAVLAIRGEKLPDPNVLGNAGSFFMNPLVSKEHFERIRQAYPEVPGYPTGDKVKVPAGWLIEQCGLKGKRHGHVGVYEKQALILVNYGEATGDEIALMAESIRAAVKDRFGIELMPEVKYIA